MIECSPFIIAYKSLFLGAVNFLQDGTLHSSVKVGFPGSSQVNGKDRQMNVWEVMLGSVEAEFC